MKYLSYLTALSISLLGLVSAAAAKDYLLENDQIGRVLVVEKRVLKTKEVINKMAGTKAVPTACDEFRLRISSGTHTTDTDVTLTSGDFKSGKPDRYKVDGGGEGFSFELKNKKHDLTVNVHYELGNDDFYMRKYLEITSGKPVALERMDIDSMSFEDAEQPYKIKAIYTRGKWSPGLGQPLYTTNSATFWGIEFPAAYNYVEDNNLYSGYQWGKEIKAKETYRTYSAVVGVSDDPEFNQDAFFKYIDEIRIRPFRLQIQYNSWFDYFSDVKKETFGESVALTHKKLVEERGNRPLSAYVIDDGWQDYRGKGWAKKTWPVNKKFDSDFAYSLKAVASAKSTMGIWMSPGSLFGARRAVDQYRKAGLEALDDWMSLAGPKYMQLLEDRIVELTSLGVTYFKLDGCFGHLHLRNFELHGEKYGIPYMPQLGLEGIKSGDAALNDSKYDELKIYYLTAGTERLMKIFEEMSKTNPEIYIVISNGAYLSPWWLMHVDSVWMINAGDAAGGSSRTKELVYRDKCYHDIWQRENTQFPMHAIFNHEPKKVKTGETKDAFRKYLYMNMSRGTGFVELYIKPAVLKEYDWDVLSEGLHWVYDVFPTFKRSRMHGGNPKKGEVYGYTAWTEGQGYVSLHNPSGEEREYSFKLDRSFGLMPVTGSYLLSSPMDDSLEGLKGEYAVGDTITVKLASKEIRILNFSKEKKDWSVLKALQVRNEGPPPPQPPPPPPPIGNHAVLGTWEYESGSMYSREFRKDGYCILRRGEKEMWKKRFAVKDEKTVIVEKRYQHILSDPDTLEIEGLYTAKRKK